MALQSCRSHRHRIAIGIFCNVNVNSAFTEGLQFICKDKNETYYHSAPQIYQMEK